MGPASNVQALQKDHEQKDESVIEFFKALFMVYTTLLLLAALAAVSTFVLALLIRAFK